MKNIKTCFNIGYWLLMSALIIIGLLTTLSALQLPKNYRVFVVQTGSMTPAIKAGSVVVVQPQEKYQKEDIITYKTSIDADLKNPKMTITHRVIEREEVDDQVFFQTKGDANKAADMNRVNKKMILGKVIFDVPYLGYPVSFAKTQTGFILLIVIPATIIVYSEVISVKNESKNLLAKKRKKKPAENSTKN
jgi:signal peptidase I